MQNVKHGKRCIDGRGFNGFIFAFGLVCFLWCLSFIFICAFLLADKIIK